MRDLDCNIEAASTADEISESARSRFECPLAFFDRVGNGNGDLILPRDNGLSFFFTRIDDFFWCHGRRGWIRTTDP